ncbi:aromatic alcohol reductase [Aspergillus saccharolyticus JOP 1030-1]|uniref:Putative isoflavone reductase n=1 Tax=Aspergillus saccharolyticus JOP 1030-1 TaxID=1450539 RepID=A0A318ZQ33_9EURO|nr:putative isoflavone reductase [Aspergillus saccharolyticus JOP 1030-1]PYH46050.1 putative isoflavone reductase [Aspergillus saccharolyticus JOP 1030-1]
MASPKVAIAGASGNLGPSIVQELLAAGLEVTALTRQDSNKTFDERVKVSAVDYDSPESLQSALQGQDVVVDARAIVPSESTIRLIDAAIAAGVTRFIPSEFGTDTLNPRSAELPVFANKVASRQYLEQVAQSSPLSYSLLFTGPFLDFGLRTGFLVNLAGPVAELYGGGDRRVSSTTLQGIGRAVVGIVRNLEATKNAALYISEADVTQKQLIELSGKKLETKVVATEELERIGRAELSKPEPNRGIVAVNLIRRALFGEGFGSLFEEQNLANELLGLKRLTEEELRELVVKFSTTA